MKNIDFKSLIPYALLVIFLIVFLMIPIRKDEVQSDYKFIIEVTNYKAGFYPETTNIYCDSIEIFSKEEAVAWVDGTSINLFGDDIVVKNINKK
jgi:hypothetical protein